MSRLSCVQNYLCPDFRAFQTKIWAIICAFMSRQLCVQKTLCPDFRAFKIAYVQTFVHSKKKIVRYFVRSCPDNRAFKKLYVQTFVRSKLPMSRLSCVPNQSACAPKFTIVIKIIIFFSSLCMLCVVLILRFLNSGLTNLQEAVSCHFQGFRYS